MSDQEFPDEIVEGELVDQFDGADEHGDFADSRYGQVSTFSRPSIHYVNESGLPQDVIDRHFQRGRGYREISSIIENWSQSLAAPHMNQTIDVFNRNRYPQNDVHMHAVMSRTAWAVENDDILSTLADVVEGLTWQKCRFELIDGDQQDMWNQWAGDIDLDSQLRKMGRELFKVSQFYVGLWWERKVYSVNEDDITKKIEDLEAEREARDLEKRIKAREEYVAANQGVEGFVMPPEVPQPTEKRATGGNRKRKKKFPVEVPTALTIFDPTKVIPVGSMMFGRQRYAYIATREENEAFAQVMRGDVADGTVLQLLEKKYEPTGADRAACSELGVDHDMLWLFKKDALFCHTVTKADYERYAPVRLKPILPILEMKSHMRASDRAALIGNTNFIVVITKGTDKLPAKAAEIANLQEQAKVIARMPVLVGDHRLNVEIVAPPLDHVLMPTRWDTLDSRLVFAALRSYAPVIQGGNSSGAGVSEMSKVVARGLESQRHMIIRSLEKHIFKLIVDRNEGILDESPKLEFTPKRISLDFNADVIGQILKLRDRGDISRETTLEELDYDQDREALRRAKEKVIHDSVFESQTPHSSPLTNPYGAIGAQQAPPQQQPGFTGNNNENAPSNVGPKGQPRTEGGRPTGARDKSPRATSRKS